MSNVESQNAKSGHSFPWGTFWSAVGALVGIATIVISLVFTNQPSPLPLVQPTSSPSPAQSSPEGTLTVPPPSSDSPAPAQDHEPDEFRLQGLLFPGTIKDCTPNRDVESSQVLAALNCTATRAGPERTPLIRQFASGAALEESMEKESSFVTNPEGNCSSGNEYAGHWKLFEITRGNLVCRYQNGLFRIAWSYHSANISIVAESTNPTELWSWWLYTCGHSFHQ